MAGRTLVRSIAPLMVVDICTMLVFAFPASAALVHAETWALWAHGINPSGVEEWRMVEVTTAAKCWARISNLKISNVDVGAIRAAVDGHRTTGYYRDGGTYVVEFTCLPNGARR